MVLHSVWKVCIAKMVLVIHEAMRVLRREVRAGRGSSETIYWQAVRSRSRKTVGNHEVAVWLWSVSSKSKDVPAHEQYHTSDQIQLLVGR
jgi:hypothetical protein